MSATNETYLPNYDELYVPPLNVTSPALKAAAVHFGKYCNKQNNEYMLCKTEEKDPRKCLRYNKEVSYCALDFYEKIKQNCAESFKSYWECLDNAPRGQMSYQYCKNIQVNFDNCMTEKLNLERPLLGHSSRIRLHDSERPKPVDKFFENTVPQSIPVSEEITKEAKESLKKANRFF